MFSFLKEKLKGALSAFSQKAEEEAEEEVIEEAAPAKKEPKKEYKKAPAKKEEPKKKVEPRKEEKKAPVKAPAEKKAEPKKEEKAPPKKEPAQRKEEPKPTPKPEPKKEEKTPARKEESPKEEAAPPKKPGFFSKLFGFGGKEEENPAEEKKEEPKAEEEKPEAEEEAPTLEFEEETEEEKQKPSKHLEIELPESIDELEEEEKKAAEEEEPAEEAQEEEPEEEAPAEEEPEEEQEEPAEEAEETEEETEEEPEEKPAPRKEAEKAIEEEATGFFARLTQKIVTKKITDAQFEDLFFDLELALLENNVALEVIDKIKTDLKGQIVDKPIKRGKVEETILAVLKESINSLFITNNIDLLKLAKTKKPFVICLVGINGSGKTTTIAKLARYFMDNGLDPVIAAADTFRAAAIDQLEEHGSKLGVKVIKHDYGSDAAAVAFDAIKHAESKGKDVVLVDTAGRMHSNANLMDEMKKIIRVAKPDLKIFIGESIAGNDCVEQAKAFNEAIGIDGIILSKADVDEKGGAALSVSYVTGKPIMYIGVGQEYKDLKPFTPSIVMENLGL